MSKKVKKAEEILDECPQHGKAYDATIEACQLCEVDTPKYATSCKAATPVKEKAGKEKAGKEKAGKEKAKKEGGTKVAGVGALVATMLKAKNSDKEIEKAVAKAYANKGNTDADFAKKRFLIYKNIALKVSKK